MIRRIETWATGQDYFELQQFMRQEQGWKLIIVTSVLLLGLVIAELFWLEPTVSSYVKSLFSGGIAVLGLVAFVLWLVVQVIPIKVRWQTASLVLAGLLGSCWAVLFPLLIHYSHFSSFYVYSDLFIFLSVVAFFSYRPAMYLAIGPVFCSFLFSGMYLDLTHEAITVLSVASRLVIVIVVRECLYHWFHASVCHEFEEQRLRLELASVALVDPVTGLQNNKHFELMLDREIMAARRHHSELTLVIVSVEPLRLYTMTCGHQAYELLLNRVTKGLRRSVYRPRDFIARVGSEEFAILLPDTDLSGADVVAKRVQRHVHRCCDNLVKADLDQPISVMISVMEWAPNYSVNKMRKCMHDAINELRQEYEQDEDCEQADVIARYEPQNSHR
ncbi:membrane-associated sensor domain-containing protein [Photobacterium sp. SDRW27]|uniref:membrane-associated sensor domain-containing protein n=1 Tax=Photobacterium obscurum TaxID=2829490 RepID=UPI002242E83F|nr:membrane-associated sensor domain-containing protein [Photobacterium obscurum]MCW8330672.1 membrane-associated sensor domain-containing protein [Photobacterium obscurum]